MHKIMTRAAETALAAGVAGGALLVGATVAGAQEAEPPTTASGDGVLAGNAVNADVDAPVTLCGVAASLLGAATGSCDAPPTPPAAAVPDTTVAQASGDGVGTGNAVGLDVDAPITICGVGVVGGGVASGSCGGGPAPVPAAAAEGDGTGDTTVARAQGNGVLAGNAIGLDVDVPITVCGVGGALLGAATGNCTLPLPAGGPGGSGGDTVVAQAQGNGLLSGNAVGLNVDLPINICGIGFAVGGLAVGDCARPAGSGGSALAATAGSTTTATASGDGVLTGNAIAVDLDAPIGVCGVGIAGLGVATGTCHVGPPPCGHQCPPPPCGHECPPPSPCEHHCPPPPPRPPRCDDGCPPPPPPPDRREHARPMVHRTALRSGASFRGELPRTGAATDAALPLGTGLVAAGLAFLAAARRRAARVGHPGR